MERLSLGAKVNLAVLLSTGIALSIAAGVHTGREILDFRPQLELQNRKLAQVVAENVSAAILFLDVEAMHENLDAFALIPEVYAARILDTENGSLARYLSERFEGQTDPFTIDLPHAFRISTPVVVQGEWVGTLELIIGLDALEDSIREFVLIALVALLISMLPALATIRYMKPNILRPVHQLSTAMGRITSTQDYNARVRKLVDDEFGHLADRFNAMLDEIQRRDQRLAKTAAEMTEAKDLAEKANTTKTKFIANMSHELRTPLNAIIGYAEMVIEDLDDIDQDLQISDLNRILVAARHLLGLINDVLDVAKIEAGKLEIHLTPTDLPLLISEAIEAVRPTAIKNGNEVSSEIDQAVGIAQVDPTRFRQCLLNLLSNACKFTSDGAVKLRATLQPGANASVIRIDVEDTGIGIEKEKMRNLFLPFVQVDSSMTRSHGGSGLGLSITRDLVVAMGGDVKVTSAPGQGSCFTITLPVNSEASAAENEETVTPLPQPDALPTVLVIEDSQDSALLLQRWLEPQGYVVPIAESGRVGLHVAKEVNPGLVILDIDLPDITGWEVLEQMTRGPDGIEAAIILLTVEEDRQRALMLGASELITKPIQKSALIEMVNAHIGQHPKQTIIIANRDRMPVLARVIERAGYRVEPRESDGHSMDVAGLPATGIVVDGALLIDANDFADASSFPAHNCDRTILWCGDELSAQASRDPRAAAMS
ncbi:MAG: ATP-binding protein, partial [Pseudomonadota bacterium]